MTDTPAEKPDPGMGVFNIAEKAKRAAHEACPCRDGGGCGNKQTLCEHNPRAQGTVATRYKCLWEGHAALDAACAAALEEGERKGREYELQNCLNMFTEGSAPWLAIRRRIAAREGHK